MSQKKIYSIDPKDIQIIISEWKKVKPIADEYTKVIETANCELMEYINNRTPLTNPNYGHLSKFSRMNRIMSIYTSTIPDFLKQVKSGVTPTLLNEDIIEKLSLIAREATEWKKAYNKAVSEYKSIQSVYKLTFYNKDGTFNFTDWL